LNPGCCFLGDLVAQRGELELRLAEAQAPPHPNIWTEYLHVDDDPRPWIEATVHGVIIGPSRRKGRTSGHLGKATYFTTR
jgi:hypothetical protein